MFYFEDFYLCINKPTLIDFILYLKKFYAYKLTIILNKWLFFADKNDYSPLLIHDLFLIIEHL